VSLVSVSRPSILEILLKDKSSHVKFVCRMRCKILRHNCKGSQFIKVCLICHCTHIAGYEYCTTRDQDILLHAQ